MLLKEPPVDGVNTTVMFSEPFEEEVFPADATKTNNPHATGACWTRADDETVSKYSMYNYVRFILNRQYVAEYHNRKI